uniref:Uncharacterized protein n=1 Tax=Rhizophora mucronata TaxID=61149 RepID=A0A2P2PEP4_RHIMU
MIIRICYFFCEKTFSSSPFLFPYISSQRNNWLKILSKCNC